MTNVTNACRHCSGDMSHKAAQARYCSETCKNHAREVRDPDRHLRRTPETIEKRREYRRNHEWVPTSPESIAKRAAWEAKYRDRYRARSRELARARYALVRDDLAAAYRDAKPVRYCSADECNREIDKSRQRSAIYCSLRCQQVTAQAAWAKNNVERRRATARAHAIANRQQHALDQMNREARKRASSVARITTQDLVARFQMWGGNCWMCGGPANQIEHVKPISKAGPHILANLRPACRTCNIRKSDKWFGVDRLHEFRRIRSVIPGAQV